MGSSGAKAGSSCASTVSSGASTSLAALVREAAVPVPDLFHTYGVLR